MIGACFLICIVLFETAHARSTITSRKEHLILVSWHLTDFHSSYPLAIGTKTIFTRWTYFPYSTYVTQEGIIDVLLICRKKNSPPMKNLIFWDMTQFYKIVWSEEKELFRAWRPFSAWEIAFCFSIVFDYDLLRFFFNFLKTRREN